MNDKNDDTESEVVKFATENTEFLSRILAHGDAEARGYVLAVFAQGGTVEDIEVVQQRLEEIKQDVEE